MRARRIGCGALMIAAVGGMAPAAAPEGFGRFGRFNDDGLLTLNVEPYRFQSAAPSNGVTVSFGSSSTVATVGSIDTSAKVLNLSGGGAGAPTSVRYTLLYPGFSAEFGTSAVLSFSGTGYQAELLTTTSSPTFRGLLVTATSGSAVPILVAFREGFEPDSWTFNVSSGTRRLSISDGEAMGEVRIVTPTGMEKFAAAASGAERDALRVKARAWLGLGVPVLQDRQVVYSREAGTVTITESYTHGTGSAIAPIPPVLAFALENGYPASVTGELVKPGVTTKYGPFAHVEGSQVSYTPVPPVEERGLVRATADPARVSLLNGLVSRLGADWAVNAVDLGYVGMAPAQVSWVYLSTQNRNALANGWSTYLPQAFVLPPYAGGAKETWKSETEPFSGLQYYWTFTLPGGPGDAYKLDLDWGIALPLYGMQKYAQYTGNWQFVRDRWGTVKQVFKFFDHGDDWAWMHVVNGDMGWSTGTGDPMTATVGGHAACYKMAKAIGDDEMEEHFAMRLARVMVPATMRFSYRQWARDRGYIGQNEVVQGFWEKETFTASEATEGTRDPWGPTNVLSGNGLMPEFFQPAAAYAKEAMAGYEQFYASRYPDWANGSHSYPFSPLYGGNSVYVVFPHVYTRFMLGEETANLWGYVDSSQSNRGTTSWIGPPLIAELLSREVPVLLRDWTPARYVDGVYDGATRKATLDFEKSGAGAWSVAASIRETDHPKRVLVGGVETPFTFSEGRLSVPLSAKGSVRVEVELMDPPQPVSYWQLY